MTSKNGSLKIWHVAKICGKQLKYLSGGWYVVINSHIKLSVHSVRLDDVCVQHMGICTVVIFSTGIQFAGKINEAMHQI